LKGGFDTWKNAGMEYDTVSSVSAETLEEILEEKVPVFDVRKEGEYTAEHIVDVPSTPLDFINDHLAEFPKEEEFYVHCAGGYRSMIAASILKARGYHNIINVIGGFAAIKKTTIKTTNYVCPTTLK
jgi:rhodanese-related sulfurtransferase